MDPHAVDPETQPGLTVDNLGKLVPKCQTILDFDAARDDAGSSGANQNWKMHTTPASPWLP